MSNRPTQLETEGWTNGENPTSASQDPSGTRVIVPRHAVSLAVYRRLQACVAVLVDFFASHAAIAWTAYGFVFVAVFGWVLLGELDPSPAHGLVTPPDWASWFDIYITFPFLAVLCLLPFRGPRTTTTLLALVTAVPLAEIAFSFYVFYGSAPLGLASLKVSWTALVPAYVFIPLLTFPIAAGVALSVGLFRDAVHLNSKYSREYFWLIASYSFLFAYLQIILRSVSGASLIGLTSDVGIATNAGGHDLLMGINPYTNPIPPWGGPAGLAYGPVSFVLAAPFSVFPQPISSHLGTTVYLIVMAVGIWKCLDTVNVRYSGIGALLFLSLPTTSWVLEGGMELHAIGGAMIIWTIYAFLAGRNKLAGLLGGLGFFTIVVPGVLVIVLLFASRRWKDRMNILVPFLFVVGGAFAIAAIALPSLLFQGMTRILSNPAVGTLALNSYLPVWASGIAAYSCTGLLVGWAAWAVMKRGSRFGSLPVLATVVLLLPFSVGTYFPFFFVWGSAVAVLSLFAGTGLNAVR